MNIRTLFWLATAIALLIPIFGIGVLRLYEVSLLRTTERQLIAQSIVVGESYREAMNLAGTDPIPPTTKGRLAPQKPRITGETPYLPSVRTHENCQPQKLVPKKKMHRLSGLLKRAQMRNLSVVRVLDQKGCSVASSMTRVGRDFSNMPEVERALDGAYGYALRLRKKGPIPPLDSMSRRGRIRVFTAVPVFADGDLIGVITASRTGLDPVSRLFQQRRSYLSLAALTLICVVILVFAASASIVGPIRSLTEHARRLKAGTAKARWQPSYLAPRETVILGEVLDDASQAIRSRADAIANFARDVSHELKTPITAVRGAAELLRDSSNEMSDTQRARFADNIVNDAARMSRLVGRLLQLARLDNPSAFDTPEALDAVEATRTLAERHERVSVLVHGIPRSVHLRQDHLDSLVVNLLDNALNYGEGEVKLAWTFETGQAVLEVSDQGPGIAENHMDRVCEPFFTTSRNEGGTGLGLSIVRAIVDGCSGQFSISSSDTGTHIRIIIPDEDLRR